MKYLILLFCFLLSPVNYALSLKANAPQRYVVQHGDNLWTIANRYLDHPWEWKALWRANPKIHNPNRLYAGDILVLSGIQNTPYIKVLPNGTIKLSPSARPSPIEDAIPAISLGEIQPFLDESLVLDEDILIRAPYVIAFTEGHMLGAQGVEAYVKGLHSSVELPRAGTISYSLFREKKCYTDPLSKEILGYNATLVGQADLIAGGEPATILLTNIKQGIQKEDKVLINDSPEFDLYFHPTAPTATTSTIKGFIIDMPNDMPSGNTQQAAGGVVVLSIGASNGLKPGDVLGLYGQPRLVKDPKNALLPILLPLERLGEVMIFRTFTKTSFALIVRSISSIHLMDTVSNP